MSFTCISEPCAAADNTLIAVVMLGIFFVATVIAIICVRCRIFRSKPAPVIRFVDSQDDVYIVGIDNVVVVNTVGL